MAASKFDTTRLRFGDVIAAAAGLLLFISLFLEWYTVSAESALVDVGFGGSGWEWLGFIDVLLFLCIAVAIGLAVMRALNMLPRLPIAPGLLLLGVGAVATLLVLFRLLVTPDDSGLTGVDISRSLGVFVAMVAALGMLVGGWLAWNEEGRPAPGTTPADPPGGGAVGSGQPGGGYGAPPSGAPVASSGPPPAAAPPAGGSAGAEEPPQGGKADWYPDPRGEKRLRYYDGTSWTDHVAD